MTALNERALLPCPFCGGSAELLDTGNDRSKKRSTTVKCTGCRFECTVGAIRFGLDFTRAEATKAWNRRTPYHASEPDAVAVERAECAKLAEKVSNECADLWSDAAANGVTWRAYVRDAGRAIRDRIRARSQP